MPLHLSALTVLVPDYEEAIAYFTQTLGFDLVEDTPITNTKRWVKVAPPGSGQPAILLAKATTPEQLAQVGRQAGGRVLLFITTTDFTADYARLLAAGVRFMEAPRQEAYGRVAVFEDPWGNRYDLLEELAGAAVVKDLLF